MPVVESSQIRPGAADSVGSGRARAGAEGGMMDQVRVSSAVGEERVPVGGPAAPGRRRWAGRGTWLFAAALAWLAVRADGGGAQPPVPTSPPGALVICGGGRLPDAVRDEF